MRRQTVFAIGHVAKDMADLRAGVDARLIVWEGLPHMFWLEPNLPEAIEANHMMADFFVKALGK